MSPNQYRKGQRNQRKVRDFLQERGYRVEIQRGSRFGNTDFFNQFDIIALKKDEPPHFIQVKSNGISELKSILTFSKNNIASKHAIVEIFSWWDYCGLEVRRLIDGEWVKILDQRTDFEMDKGFY